MARKISKSQKPFQNCWLNREHEAESLTEIIQTYDSGFVLAINGKWGAGKTTFVRMWKEMLCNKYNYETILYNAWESDLIASPMISILGEIKTTTKSVNISELIPL